MDNKVLFGRLLWILFVRFYEKVEIILFCEKFFDWLDLIKIIRMKGYFSIFELVFAVCIVKIFLILLYIFERLC